MFLKPPEEINHTNLGSHQNYAIQYEEPNESIEKEKMSQAPTCSLYGYEATDFDN